MPPSPQNDKYEIFNKERIPTARYFDYDEISDKTSSLPHMLPNNEVFSKLISPFNLTKEDPIVVYDDFGVIGACRVYWMLKTFGFENVKVLDGGFQKWKESFEVETSKYEKSLNASSKNTFEKNHKLVKDFDQVCEVSFHARNQNLFEIIDARGEARF